jgi:hypothetical protein
MLGFINGFVTVLLVLWTLPQTVLGLIVFGGVKVLWGDGVTICFLWKSPLYRGRGAFVGWLSVARAVSVVVRRRFGVSLGLVVFSTYGTITSRHHELGHYVQSNLFGPLYLLLVGLPSVVLNLLSRFFGADSKFTRNYYNRYPENWADLLGKVHRIK